MCTMFCDFLPFLRLSLEQDLPSRNPSALIYTSPPLPSHVINLNIQLFTGFLDNFFCRFSNFTLQYLPAILRRKNKNFIPVKFSNGAWSIKIKYNIQFVIRNS